ncbi:Cu(I)-responsive transcriptional regulator [Mameliella alba]|uniref:Cu(I)-responsive transcriptional regulator n=1 Tax=Mameliella alba TaxID=561184 RepID=UPI000B53789C|nr:Cu(I)-responsive transcriptional regulator [Mameliella alba]OWV39280.1 Cu(I)-responsive transcriptional regulator [Mameliella alba]OWV52442.1 Cu(I)-responsive transcriptional regulator [Mameliella alba]BBU53890.1 transcriptional regulator [Mameliella alba]
MNIGEAAKQSGVSAKMIRYYEQTGLIPPAQRTDSGYRDYSEKDVHMLSFVRRARDLGFSVEVIGELLGLWTDRSRRSVDVRQLAEGHLSNLRRKIEELEAMSSTLETLINACHGDHRPDCPIIADLEKSEPTGSSREPKSRAGAVDPAMRALRR